jgi:hypothetical protein
MAIFVRILGLSLFFFSYRLPFEEAMILKKLMEFQIGYRRCYLGIRFCSTLKVEPVAYLFDSKSGNFMALVQTFVLDHENYNLF